MDAKKINAWIEPTAKIIAWFGLGYIAYKAGQKFGIFESEAEATGKKAAGDTTATDTANALLAFSPLYRTTIAKQYTKDTRQPFSPTKQLSGINLKDIAETVVKANWAVTDEAQLNLILGALRRVQTQYQLSAVADYFSRMYKNDMLSFIKGLLPDSELQQVYDFVNNFPLYKK